MQTIEDAKPNKLYLFFPTVDDANFPESGCTVGSAGCFGLPSYASNIKPAKAFDLAGIPSYKGTSVELQNAIRDVVVDDYCEFNIQVFSTNAVPPTTFPRRVSVAIGSDGPTDGTWGIARDVDTNDTVLEDYARVWAASYQLSGGNPADGGGASTGDLFGINSTVQRWAFAIGGTAAHEAGHTYGLTHGHGATVLTGEPGVETHIMPAGGAVPMSARAGMRRHFGETEFGILAANVGLSVETLHNWDYTNPNSTDSKKLEMEILSTSATLTVSWAYDGDLSPWSSPTVSGPSGTRVFKGTTYNVYRLTYATAKAWGGGADGTVPAGATFHVGAAFSQADFSVPDAVIISKVTLFDSSGTAQTLHPRMVGYDSGALDAADGAYNLAINNVDNPDAPLQVSNVVVQQLARVVSLRNMVTGGPMLSYDGVPVTRWGHSSSPPSCGPLGRDTKSLTLARMGQGRHIFQRHQGDCNNPDGGQVGPMDSPASPDPVNDCPRAGYSLDLFPSTMTYVTATVTDPAATHWDPAQRRFVVGPVVSHLFYQVAGRHPDLNRNGKDDAIDLDDGTSTDTNSDGVPDEVQRCLTRLRTLEVCEHDQRDVTTVRNDIVRQIGEIDACLAKGGDYACCPGAGSPQACAIGTSSLDLRDRVQVSASVATDGLTLGASGVIGQNANVLGNAFLRSSSVIRGHLDISGQLTQQAGARVLGGISRPGAAAQSTLPTTTVTPGTQPVTVENDAVRDLLPGNYGDVTIRARAHVTMTSGTYNLASLTVEGSTQISLNTSGGPLTINVRGNVMVFGFAGFVTSDPSKILLYSTGSSVTFQSNNTFPGTIIAPFANLGLSNFVTVKGCVGGKNVIVDTDSSINGTGIASHGRQGCDDRKSQLQTQLVAVESQLSAKTAECAQDLTLFRQCTGIYPLAKAATPTSPRVLEATSLNKPFPQSLPTAESNSHELAGPACSLTSLGGKVGCGALASLLLSLLLVARRGRAKTGKRN